MITHLQPEIAALLRELVTMTSLDKGVTLSPIQAKLVLSTISDQLVPTDMVVETAPSRKESRKYMVPVGGTLSLNGYQQASLRTLGVGVWEPLLFCTTMLCSEAGEFAGLVQKSRWQGHKMDREKAYEELGDMMWALSGAAWTLGLTLGEVGRTNIVKLIRRFPDGFSAERSQNRQREQ